MSNIKQVIVIRKDLKMRRGKEIVQGSHASQAWLLERIKDFNPDPLYFSHEEKEWMESGFRKVCLQVESEEQLLEIYQKAVEFDEFYPLTVHMITDAGLTEFDGVPTKTCLAIGPNDGEKIDQITGHLKLY
jgi:PTH2 family peptidyl-tRNA hydrolase